MKIAMTFAIMFVSTALFAQQYQLRSQQTEKPATEIQPESQFISSDGQTLAVEMNSTVGNKRVVGTVHLGEGGYGVFIAVPSKGSEALSPINLPKEFQKEGLMISFDYYNVDAKFKNRHVISNAITVSNVKKRKAVRK